MIFDVEWGWPDLFQCIQKIVKFEATTHLLCVAIYLEFLDAGFVVWFSTVQWREAF